MATIAFSGWAATSATNILIQNDTFNLNQLIVNDVALTAANTTTVGNDTFYLQPISLPPMTTEQQRLHELVVNHPEYGVHKKVPLRTDFYEWNRRRRKGETRLLKYFDTEDKLLWFEHRAICLHYGDDHHCDYPNRVLMISPRGLFEFRRKSGDLICRRNLWISNDEDGRHWSYEDLCLTMIFQFQMSPRNFTDYVGCRSSVARFDYPEVRDMYLYGRKMREQRAEYRKLMSVGEMAAIFMVNRKRMEVNKYKPVGNPYCSTTYSTGDSAV